MWIEATTPGPDRRSVTFRADRVLAIKQSPGSHSPWCELLFVGGGESLVVEGEPAQLAEKIEAACAELRRR